MSPKGKTPVEALLGEILKAPRKGKRRLVALVGPPASGKSTLAERLAFQLSQTGCKTQVVPMDGFHLDNRILQERGLLHKKGAPETFDTGGLTRLVAELAFGDGLFYPLFDRERDIAIAGAGAIETNCDTLIVEGNYLLSNDPSWGALKQYWDLSIALKVPAEALRGRLIDRWLKHGLTQAQAISRIEQNDLKNAKTVLSMMSAADLTYLGE